MNWPTTSSIIGSGWSYEGADVAATRREIANVVRTIAKYEPVKVFVRDPKTYDDYGDSGYEEAKSLLGNERNVEMHICPHVDSLWTRDTGPVFVRSKDGKSIENDWTTANAGVDRCCKDHLSSSTVVGAVLSFNQWGRKLLPSPESYLASTICRTLNISSVLAPFIGEGGGIEMDGEGTLIATESSLLNPNRNPGISRERLESYFSWIFGVSKTIWVPGKRGHDITDDHIDALARFSGKPGVVLLSRAFVPADTSRQKQAEIESTYLSAKKIIENETDASGRHLTTVTGQFHRSGREVRMLTLTSARARPGKSSGLRLSSGIWSFGVLCQLLNRKRRRGNGGVWG